MGWGLIHGVGANSWGGGLFMGWGLIHGVGANSWGGGLFMGWGLLQGFTACMHGSTLDGIIRPQFTTQNSANFLTTVVIDDGSFSFLLYD